MKKIVSLLLLVCLILSFSNFAFALNESKEFNINGNLFSSDEILNSQKTFEKYFQKGESILAGNTRDTWATLNVPLLLQRDSRWEDEEFPCGHTTFGESGCGMTAYSMVLNSYGFTTTPVTVAQTYSNNGSRDCCTFSSSTLIQDYYGRSVESVPNVRSKTYSQIKTAIIGALADGYRVVVKVDSTNSYPTHFVVCYAYVITTTGDIKISIRDPMGTYTYLDQYNNRSQEPISVVFVK